MQATSSFQFSVTETVNKPEIVKELDVPSAQFFRINKDGKLAISYPYEYMSYQQPIATVLLGFVPFDGFVVSDGEWSRKHDAEKRTVTLTRYPYEFELKVVNHIGQVNIRSALDDAGHKRIERVVLDGYLIKNACACSSCSKVSTNTGLSHQFSSIDFCVARNLTTDKIHLLALVPNERGKFVIKHWQMAEGN